MATTNDSAGDRRLARQAGNVIAVLGQAMEDGTGGLLKRLGWLLRDSAAQPFMDTLRSHVNAMIEEGSLKKERLEASETQTAMAQVVDDLADNAPDWRRHDTLLRAFLGVAIGDPTDPEGAKGLLFLGVARQLSAEQAAILGCAYRHRSDHSDRDSSFDAYGAWEKVALVETGLGFVAPFRAELERMLPMHLIYGTAKWKKGRGILTEFGVAFCEFLKRSRPFEDEGS